MGISHSQLAHMGPWARPWEALFGPPFEQALNSHMAKPMESLTQYPRTLPEGPQNRAQNRAYFRAWEGLFGALGGPK